MKGIGYILLKGILRLFGMLPLCVHHFNASFLAFLAEKVVRYRRDDVIINLSRCFPEKNYDEIKRICKQFYLHFADLIVEAVWFGACRNPERLRKAGIVEAVNPELLDTLFDKSPSVAVMYSHCGNWELFGGIGNYVRPGSRVVEDTVCVVYRRLKSAVWDRLIGDNRLAPLIDPEHFEGYLESAEFIRYALVHRNEKKFYCVNTDQRPYFDGSDHIMVPFFYDTVGTMSAIAAVARKMGMAVVFLRQPLESRGHYKMEFVTICEDASKMSVEEIMREYYRLLEEEIREQPFNYLWTHHRWWKP